jgi:glycosyltransferase involved in cell wall biosynthesis
MFIFKYFLSISLCYLRIIDFNASKKVDIFIANSRSTKEKIKKYYGRESEVVNPFISYEDFENIQPEVGSYFLVVSRLAPWKRVDLAIEACNALEFPLRIYGEGPDLERLRSLACPTVEIMGYLSDTDKSEVMRNCKALIVTQKEDFGITPLEVMACGKPVVAYKAGGVLESVVAGKTGEFFDQQNLESLSNALRSFDVGKYSPNECKKRAKKYDRPLFQQEIRRLIKV